MSCILIRVMMEHNNAINTESVCVILLNRKYMESEFNVSAEWLSHFPRSFLVNNKVN